MIANIIKTLQEAEHYGIGEHIEIAKGKNEYSIKWVDFKRKIKRTWLSKKR